MRLGTHVIEVDLEALDSGHRAVEGANGPSGGQEWRNAMPKAQVIFDLMPAPSAGVVGDFKG